MKGYCLMCGNDFDIQDMLICPHCNAIGDEIVIEEEGKIEAE